MKDAPTPKLSGLKKYKRYITLPHLCLLGGLGLCALVGGMSASIARLMAILLFLLSACCWFYDEFYLFVPMFLFCQYYFYPFGATPTFRLYSLLLIAKVFTELKTVRFRGMMLPSLIVIFSHILFAIYPMDSTIGFSYVLDFSFVFLAITRITNDARLMRKFFFVFALSGAMAVICGLLDDNFGSVSLGRSGVYSETLRRFFLTFNDPNYAGLFSGITIFSMLCVQTPLPKWTRLPVIGIGLYSLVLCNSMTGFACFGLCSCLYIMVRWPGKSPLLLSGLAMLGIFGVYLLLTSPAVSEIPELSGIQTRINEILKSVSSGDTASASSGRSELWEGYFSYYTSQDLIHMLFGGNVITATISDPKVFLGMGTHLCFLQSLLLYGFAGTVVIFGTQISWLAYRFIHLILFDKHNPNVDVIRARLVCKMALLFFCFSIDMFPDWRFMLMMLL